MEFQEFRVSCPWGFIAGKAYGTNIDQHILLIHGMQDNAGSFDLLLEHLPKNGYYYVAIDLPGHGLSSPFSANNPIHYLDFVIAVKIIVDHFQQNSYIFIGHSLGAMISQAFVHMYPQYLHKLVSIDNIFQRNVDSRYFQNWFRTNVDSYLNTCSQLKTGNVPMYTYDEALKRVIKGRYVKISEAGAKNLMKRNLIRVNDTHYRFGNCQLLKSYFYWPTDPKYMLEVFQNTPIRKPHLLIMASDSIKSYKGIYEDFKSFYEENPLFEYREVEGNHDAHNNDPELMAGIILDFLTRSKNHL